MTQALIVGAGPGLSASFARKLAASQYAVALAARRTDKLAALALETGASLHLCDATDPESVSALFRAVPAPEVVLYNASFRVRGPFVGLNSAEVAKTLAVSAFGGFLVAQQAAKRMLEAGRGTILLTGASAGVKGFPQSAPFAMGKFALRGLARSMARELHPQGIHVIHVVVDGGIRAISRPEAEGKPDSMLDPRCDRADDAGHAATAAFVLDGRDCGAALGRAVLKSVETPQSDSTPSETASAPEAVP